MWHEAVDQGVAVAEESVHLLGGLDRRGRRRAELLPLYRHGAAAGRCHSRHLPRRLPPKERRVNAMAGGGGVGGTPKGGRLTFSVQVCLVFASKNSKAPPPAWASALSVWRLAVGLRERTQEPSKLRHAQRRRGEVRKDPCRPETAGEEAAVLHAVPEQLQGQLGVLDVTVRQQQQVSDAPGRRQQAQGPQGPPQLGAAPYWSEALGGGREASRCCLQGRHNTSAELSHSKEAQNSSEVLQKCQNGERRRLSNHRKQAATDSSFSVFSVTDGSADRKW